MKQQMRQVKMENKLQRLCDNIHKFVCISVIITASVMVISCVIQVFTRYILNNSPRWTEELARYTFIWSVLLGALICTRESKHAVVSVIVDMLPPPVRKRFGLATHLLILMLSVILVRYGWKVVQMTNVQLSPGMGLPMSYVYAGVPIFGVILFIYTLNILVRDYFST